jgi:hypothetical protein
MDLSGSASNSITQKKKSRELMLVRMRKEDMVAGNAEDV